MSLRFRRTIRVAPGLRLNLSRSGVSTSIGPRGASLTLGKRGIYANTGLPGTGLSYRTRLNGKANGPAPVPLQDTAPAPATATAPAAPVSAETVAAAAGARLDAVREDLRTHSSVPRSLSAAQPAAARRPAAKHDWARRLFLDPCGRAAFVWLSGALWLGMWALSENLVANSWQTPSLWPLRLDPDQFNLLLVGAALLQLILALRRGRDIGLPVPVTIVIGIIALALGGWAVLAGLAALVLWPGRPGSAVTPP